MPTTGNEIRAAVKQRLANIARSPDEEKKFPVGPASAKKLGCSKVQVDVHQTPWPTARPDEFSQRLPEVTEPFSVESEAITVSDWKASHVSCRLQLRR